jgi:hypothetical protein
VIVKLANIILTPEKPQYKGGVWHVEGMNNEHIVSSGIYYYDAENVSSFYSDLLPPLRLPSLFTLTLSFPILS